MKVIHKKLPNHDKKNQGQKIAIPDRVHVDLKQ